MSNIRSPAMFRAELWLTPLILLPGVALLIISTSNRFAQIDQEFHRLLEHPEAHMKVPSRHLVRRCKLLRDALMSLYVSVGLFAAASLFGGIFNFWLPGAIWIVGGPSLGGILGVLVAAVQLGRESRLVLKVIVDHHQRLHEPGP